MGTATQSKPHLAYVAWGFPPARSGGVYRALATANAFAQEGWDVTVLTAPRDLWFTHTGADTTLEAAVDPRVDVRRLPFSWPALETDLRRWSLARILFPRLWSRWRRHRDIAAFPEPAYGPWRSTLEAAVTALHGEHPVDLVVATVNPYVDASAALHLNRADGVPFVVDYRDAWSLDVFSGATVHDPESPAGHVEADLMRRARQIWFVNEPIRAWHTQRYPAAADRMRVVANGYDTAPDFSPRRVHDPLTFGYVGTISRKVPVQAFVAGWRLAQQQDRLGARDRAVLRGYLGYYQVADAALQAVVNDAAVLGVSYEGPVNKRQIGQFYADTDVLLLILGTGRYVTSGKVYEYVSTGLPVVSVHDPANAASQVLTGYPHWVPARSLGETDVADALARAADLARGLTPADIAAARSWGTRYLRSAQLTPAIRQLQQARP